ncbi:MAG TPA: 2-amino-4-hydroxy-6-hydroxymethyldihydropteridine diphosphokinase [Dehalococcoidia bacterium]|nr:2-amino-4-hydroxy-6-hydroxymethyldihydropteridine diphosphokinase [Dehalococcoidia bacterium]
MATAYLALGANVGNRRENLRMALRLLSEHVRVIEVSSLYRSEALVPEGAAPGPDFLNAVAAVETDLEPADLLRALKEIEREIGRRPAPRWAARPIDIDILLCDERVITTPDLTVPHPAMLGRNFVLVPLAEIAPGARHPAAGAAIGELAEDIDYGGLEHLEGPEWAAIDVPPAPDADGRGPR